MFLYHKDGTAPRKGDGFIFVFGSNLAGIHGAGAAKVARNCFGAMRGNGAGMCGHSYAIPTKDHKLRSLPFGAVRGYVELFVHYANAHPDLAFFVTRVGCGLAGGEDAEIAPLFADLKTRTGLTSFAEEWRQYLS